MFALYFETYIYFETNIVTQYLGWRWGIKMWWRILQTTWWIYFDRDSQVIVQDIGQILVALPKKSNFLRGFENFGTPSPITFYRLHFNLSYYNISSVLFRFGLSHLLKHSISLFVLELYQLLNASFSIHHFFHR